jgi:hypothetical protein
MGNKPRLVEVTDEALTAMDEAQQTGLDTPYVWRDGGVYWADAEELRAWREGSTTTSDGEQQ